MRFTELKIPGVFLIEIEPRLDERGFFARTFCETEFAAHGLPTHFPQCNLSRNRRRGTLRGMHFEAKPTQESKLVRCNSGAIYDVVVDLRTGSATRFRWLAAELNASSGQALFVPAGFAHGFITLADDTDVFYHMGASFRPDGARGFRWDDPAVGIEWPFAPSVISERDQTYMALDLDS